MVIIGQYGLKESVFAEIDAALRAHELIKVRVAAEDRIERSAFIESIRAHAGAELVQRLGHVAVLYRRNPARPRIDLPSA